MSLLDPFSDDDKTLLVSLPYKAGLWISMSDEKGQGTARARELKTIEAVIARLSEGQFASAFAHEVVAQTYARRAEWPSWSLQTGTVPDEARKAVMLVTSQLMPHDAEAYVQMIMNIAYETAYAYREFDQSLSIPIRFWVSLKLLWEAFIRTGNRDYRIESVANISLAEDEAIAVLASALHIDTGETIADL